MVEGGLDTTTTTRIARDIEPDVEFIDIAYSSYYVPAMIAATQETGLGYQLEAAAKVTSALTKPTIVTGRIMTMNDAQHVLDTGVADLVSMVRALIADPAIVAKSRDGRAAEVRPCIGSNQGCIAGTMVGNFHCVVNPEAGRETKIPHELEPASAPRRVLVVGGGPAGLEASRTAALRGHDVTLLEMKRFLGGQVAIAAKAPGRADYAAITRWLADELERLDVNVRLGTPVDPDVIAEFDPDVLIVATGSEPRRDGRQVQRPVGGLPGADLSHVYTSWDVFGVGGRASVGTHAVVYDDTGLFEPLSVADALLEHGAEVTYITQFQGFAGRISQRPEVIGTIINRLSRNGIRLIVNSHLTKISQSEVEYDSYGSVRTVDADTVVLCLLNETNDMLADPTILGDFRGDVHVIGDAAGERSLTSAIHQGNALGRVV
jgi:NADPH-dependent 2,4-dienoyl-CoA reductase/sulfur reductase-like enzyme